MDKNKVFVYLREKLEDGTSRKGPSMEVEISKAIEMIRSKEGQAINCPVGVLPPELESSQEKARDRKKPLSISEKKENVSN